MRITKKLQIVALAALSLGIASLCFAQSDAPYTEGPVWNITMVKTKSGMVDEYLKGLAKTLKGTLEEAKKQKSNPRLQDLARQRRHTAGLRHPSDGGIEEHGRAG